MKIAHKKILEVIPVSKKIQTFLLKQKKTLTALN